MVKDNFEGNIAELKEFLDEKVEKYNTSNFIPTDPIQIPHKFSNKEDIEISGFLTSIIAWGQRKTIIKNCERMLEIMDYSPHDFILNFTSADLKRVKGFVHRTFNEVDFGVFLLALQRIYRENGGLEGSFSSLAQKTNGDLQLAITEFKELFFLGSTSQRTFKHLPNPQKGSAAKRINMFLRWMVRKDNKGVDFGIWPSISPSALSCPLDVHSGNTARKLGLLSCKDNNAKAVRELDAKLRILDPVDPAKYDFALFGLGAFEEF